MENGSLCVVVLEGLQVSPRWRAPAFAALLLSYVCVLCAHVCVVVLVSGSRKLHQPVYLLLCNMSANDALGASVIIPHVLRDLARAAPERRTSCASCFTQALAVHLYGSTSHTVLAAMAFDRYLAVCRPLRYAALMTRRAVALLSAAAWGASAAPVAAMLGLTLRLPRCRHRVDNLFCDHASLLALSCERAPLNQAFGLSFSALLLGGSLGAVALTYLKIAAVCLRGRGGTSNRKALHTCAAHLSVYALLLLSAFVVIALHRFPRLAPHRKAFAIAGAVLLPALNAAIYALQMKELRQRIRRLLCRRTSCLRSAERVR